MTAQIAILNRTAIALASDSAVTMDIGRKRKIFTSANKLFRLSKVHPVGIMVYGNAELLDVPWEATIKVYREQLGQKAFDTVREQADDFLKFLDGGASSLFPQAAQDRFVSSSVYAYFNYMRGQIEKEVRNVLNEKGVITESQTLRIISSLVANHQRQWQRALAVPSLPAEHASKTLARYRSNVDEAIRAVFEQLPLNKGQRKGLRDIATQLLVKKLPKSISNEGLSGIVIAGFGDKEVFPNLFEFTVDGIVEDRLRHWEGGSTRIGVDATASIMPFAQDDMVVTFMEGVNPDYSISHDALLSEVFRNHTNEAINLAQSCGCAQPNDVRRLRSELTKLRKDVLRRVDRKITELKRSKFIDPITSVVEMLPKDELAAMAESLVNLTLFQRRVSLQAETVAGAIDVAVISKGDGFVWIKRKFYFDPRLNPGFVANYYKDVHDGEKTA